MIVVVISSFDRDGNLSFSFFDSHSRDDRGITARKTGFSVLLQFPNLSEFKKNLEVAYEIVVTLHIFSFSVTDVMHIQDVFRNKRKKWKKNALRGTFL